MEYGEIEYSGAMNKEETLELLESKNFELLKDYNSGSSKGDFLFKNKS